jgi:sulfotransferase family protein
MKLPDFVVVGAAKSGTISLYHYLRQHPSIFMCPINECNFFALEHADWQAEYRSPVDRLYLHQHCTKTLESYRDLFKEAVSHQVIGESSPLYLFSEKAAERIHHHIPNAKIIAILRQPADRGFSNFQDLRRGGIEPIDDFGAAIRAETERRHEGWGPWPFWYYTGMGYYARQLKNYFKWFERSNVFIRLYEDLQEDAVSLMKDIYHFIGVDRNFEPDVSTRHNTGGAPSSTRSNCRLEYEQGASRP